jgi:hypothetical protein
MAAAKGDFQAVEKIFAYICKYDENENQNLAGINNLAGKTPRDLAEAPLKTLHIRDLRGQNLKKIINVLTPHDNLRQIVRTWDYEGWQNERNKEE